MTSNLSSQSGVAIFYILLAIILFAALSFAFTQSLNSSGSTDVGDQEAKIYAQDILNYARRVDRGVQRVLSRGCSEQEISFYSTDIDALSIYQHASEVDDRCKVFHDQGGAAGWLSPPETANDGSLWMFTAQNRVIGLYNDAAGNGNELMLVLGGVKKQVCTALNKLTDIGDILPVDDGDVGTGSFVGDFNAADSYEIYDSSASVLESRPTACFQATNVNGSASSGAYYFYHVLLAR